MKKILLSFIFICACATTYAYPRGIAGSIYKS